MKKLFIFTMAIFIFACPLLRVSGQENLDKIEKYKGFDLNYGLVGTVMHFKPMFQEVYKRQSSLMLDSLQFSIDSYINLRSGITFYSSDVTIESLNIWWGKNKIVTNILGETEYKRQDDFFLVEYYRMDLDSNNNPVPSKEIFYFDKNGNGGYFKEDTKGSFILKITGPDKMYSPLSTGEIIKFKKRMIDLFYAINIAYQELK